MAALNDIHPESFQQQGEQFEEQQYELQLIRERIDQLKAELNDLNRREEHRHRD